MQVQKLSKFVDITKACAESGLSKDLIGFSAAFVRSPSPKMTGKKRKRCGQVAPRFRKGRGPSTSLRTRLGNKGTREQENKDEGTRKWGNGTKGL
jgi:hypothetical protein